MVTMCMQNFIFVGEGAIDPVDCYQYKLCCKGMIPIVGKCSDLCVFVLQLISMPHQWLEGNLPVSAKCTVCDKTCGSVLKLQDCRCLWCKAMVRTSLSASLNYSIIYYSRYV